MNNLKKIILITFISSFSLGSFAQSVSSWGNTISEAESKIEKIANESNSKYKIIAARMGDYAYVTAKLIK
ncbi:hypothetical protein MASR2M36_20360 [Providencia sp.]